MKTFYIWLYLGVAMALLALFFVFVGLEIWHDPMVRYWDGYDRKWEYHDPHNWAMMAVADLGAFLVWGFGGELLRWELDRLHGGKTLGGLVIRGSNDWC